MPAAGMDSMGAGGASTLSCGRTYGLLRHGRKTVGTTAVQLTSTATALRRGVRLKAKAGQAGLVYVGTSSAVTAGAGGGQGGYELDDGKEVFVRCNDLSKIWVIASQASQDVFWIAL